MTARAGRVAIAGSLAVLAGGCLPLPNDRVLTIGAATSLRESATEIAAAFEQETGETVRLTFAASGTLRRQIERDAPIDIFLSADSRAIDALDPAELDPKSRLIFARNCLVVAVPSDPSAEPRLLRDLVELAEFDRIAIGNPDTVPAGRYARVALESAGIYDRLEADGKLVFGEHVRQVLTYAERGEVDAALVYDTDVRSTAEATIAYRVPNAMTPPIVYEMAAITPTAADDRAQSFVDFILSDRAREIFQARGFRRADIEPNCGNRAVQPTH